MTKPITVIGGMGPQASERLYRLIIELSQKHPLAERGIFPHVVLRSLAIPDFISSTKHTTRAQSILVDAADSAQHDDPCAVAIACNTAHVFSDVFTQRFGEAFVPMIDSVVEEVKSRGIHSVGLLASPTTIRTKLYTQALHEKAIACIEPAANQQKMLEKSIRSVINGTSTPAEADAVLHIAHTLIKRDAHGIILGCTELPLLFPKADFTLPLFDSIEIMAQKLVNIYYESEVY